MIQRTKSKILEIENLTKGTKNFVLSVPKDFNFKAGQYILLELPVGGKIQRRAYSISSAPRKKYLELCIKFSSGSSFSQKLKKLKKGSEINLIGPTGNFFIDKKPINNLVFISAGTGIAPLKSMIENLLVNLKFKREILLISGYHYEENILYKDYFEKLEKRFPNFKQRIVLSKPRKVSTKMLKGYVQDFIEKSKSDTDFYICGMKEMISKVVNKLEKLKIKKEKIFFEKYD